MSIKVRVKKSTDALNPVTLGYLIEVEEDCLEIFAQMVSRALNTWDDAPPDLKQLGDMLSHGHVLQDYTGNHSMSNVVSGDTGPDKFPELESRDLPICEYCGARGEAHYHTCPKLLKDSDAKTLKEKSGD